jgi:ankyrin repeat protein
MLSLVLLLQQGADVDSEDKFRWTALQLAARFGYRYIVSVLIANGADINKEGFHGWTTCYYAHREGHAKVESLLRHSGAKMVPTERTRTGWSPRSRLG